MKHISEGQDVPIDLDLMEALVIDVETTGTDTTKDRIVQIAIAFGIGHAPQVLLINPGVHIPPAATEVHGITNAMVANAQRFPATAIAALLFKTKVVVGYNVRFDLDMIVRECGLAGVDVVLPRIIVDPLRLWQNHEPRSLEGAFKRFGPGDRIFSPHDAGEDVRATGDVLLGMLRAFRCGDQTWAQLGDLCYPERAVWIGPTFHVQWQGGAPALMFGKHKDRHITKIPREYREWMVERGDFPKHVAEIVQVSLGVEPGEFVSRVARKYGTPPTEIEKGARS